MTILSLLVLALKRLKSRLPLTLLLLGAALLVVALISCIPAFSGGVSLRIMQQEIEAQARRNGQPPLSVRAYAMASARQPIDVEQALTVQTWLRDRLQRALDLPIDSTYLQIESPEWPLQPRPDDPHYSKVIDRVAITYIEGLGEQIETVAGLPFASEGPDDRLSVWVERHYADRIGLQVGESYVLHDPRGGLGDLAVTIAGIWQPIDASGRFWYLDPSSQMNHKLLTTRAQFEAFACPRTAGKSAFCAWYLVFADRHVNLARAEHYTDGFAKVGMEVTSRLPDAALDHAPVEALHKGSARQKTLTLILLGFSVPVIAIVLYFVSVLSGMVVSLQRQEIAMFASRGSSRSQILLLTLVETVLVLVVATPLGLFAGIALARLLGNSWGFMRFAAREALPVQMASVEWWMVALALAVTALSRLLPTWLAADQSIVEQERQAARQPWKAGMARLLLIGFLGLVSWYAYQRLRSAGTLSLVSWEAAETHLDPLLLLAPSLFLLTMPLLAGEVFVLLVRPLEWLASWAPGMGPYLGLCDLGRNGGQYRRPIYMLVLCLGLGVFYASLAKSADGWLTDRRIYEVGTDLTFAPEWDTQLDEYDLTYEEILEVWGRPWEVRMEEYETIPGVVQAMPVGEYRILSMRAPKGYVRVMAVDPWLFPRVVRYHSHYGPEELGELMNRLAANPRGVLIGENAAEIMGWHVGDPLSFTLEVPREIRVFSQFEVVGAFDYFPTRVSPTDVLMVANLDYLQSLGAYQLPFHVWFRLENGADPQSVVQAVHQRYKILATFEHDINSLVIEDGERLERVGIFGMLTISFLAGALLAALGLVVHSAASMQGRSLRFAILQALGMSRSTLMASLLVQYLMMLLYSIAVGTGVGIACSAWYGPFFQLADTVGAPVPPYVPLVDQQRALALALALTVTLLLIEVALFIHLARTRVFETLRLGTRE